MDSPYFEFIKKANYEEDLLMKKIEEQIKFRFTLPNPNSIQYDKCKKIFKKKLSSCKEYLEIAKKYYESVDEKSYSIEDILQLEWREYYDDYLYE